jgi:hypothetical protein
VWKYNFDSHYREYHKGMNIPTSVLIELGQGAGRRNQEVFIARSATETTLMKKFIKKYKM